MPEKVEVNGEKLKGCLAEGQSGGEERASEDEILAKGKVALEETVAAATEAGEVAATALVAMQHPDYFADRYVQSPNYSAGGNSGKVLVIHTVQGTYGSCINWFQNRAAQVSAHYVVGYEGETTQMVSEYDRGWHVGWENGYCIGIEHAGFIDDGYPPTEKCYHASARLAAGIKKRHPGIRIAFSSSSGICGHRNLPNQSHTDPGNEWDMKKYLALVDHYYSGGKSEPAKPVPDAGIEWVNYVYHFGDNWARKIAAAMDAALTAAGVRGAVTERAAKAAGDAREQAGVYTFLIGSDSVERAKKYQREFTDKSISYNTSGSVRVVTPSYRDRAKWRIADFCEEFKLDKGEAIQAFEAAMGAGSEVPKGGKINLNKYTPTNKYGLTAHADRVRQHITELFGPFDSISAYRGADGTEHSSRKAIDFVVGNDGAKGKRVAEYIAAHHVELEIEGLIWWAQQTGYDSYGYSSFDSGWKPQYWNPYDYGWTERMVIDRDGFHRRHPHCKTL